MSGAPASPFGWPVVVKPSREGSTVGVTIVQRAEELPAALAAARRCHGETFLERYVPGHEVSVGVLDGEVLGSVEIRPKSACYDYEAKYLRHDTEYLVPAPLPGDAEPRACAAALRAYQVTGCAAHARVDLRVDAAGGVWVLEVNTLPGMTKTSLLPKIAARRGLDYGTLVERILASAALRA